MAKEPFSDKINRLFSESDWAQARKLLNRERAKVPDSHWVLTQLGVTYYEEQRYEEALRLFLESQAIVPDCPLTLWNLAGAQDALGEYRAAIDIYTGLLEHRTATDEDSCWEGKAWTDALKTDCVYRLGVSYQHLDRQALAEHCFRRYIDLLLIGIEGSYSIEDARRQIQSLHTTPNGKEADAELKKLNVFLARHDLAGKSRRRKLVRAKVRS